MTLNRQLNHRAFVMLSFLLRALLLTLVSCTYASGQEVKRLPSPDHRVDAVEVMVAGGATAPDVLKIYLTPTGQAVGLDPVFEGDDFNGIDLGWNGLKSLTIVVASGQISHFQNTWQSRAVDDFSYTVRIHLKESNYAVFKPD